MVSENNDLIPELPDEDIINALTKASEANGEKANLQLSSADILTIEDIKVHSEVLDDITSKVLPIMVREYLRMPEEEHIKQKHIIVAGIKKILEVARENSCGLAKVYDYVYLYNGAYWKPLEVDDLKHFLVRCVIKMGFPYYDVCYHEFRDKLFKQFLADARLPSPKVDTNKVLINLLNGTFEFKENGELLLRDFSRTDFLTYQLPFAYEPGAACPLFDQYLLRVLPDECSRNLLQEYAGYIFTKLNLEKMLVLTGSGSNGKSVFFNVLSALVGRENILNYHMGLFTHEFNRAKLVNKLLNYSSEKGGDLSPDTFKALVSGEPLQAREPYGESFTLHNKVRFIMNANELPRVTEHTEAYFRRYLIILFAEKISDAERDIHLADKIIDNELPGVFNWLLEGLSRVIGQKSFSPCPQSDAVLAEFKRQSDSVAIFFDEKNYRPGGSTRMALADLYASYRVFCTDDGYRPFNKKNFSAKLESKGFEKTRLTGGATAFILNNDPIEAQTKAIEK